LKVFFEVSRRDAQQQRIDFEFRDAMVKQDDRSGRQPVLKFACNDA